MFIQARSRFRLSEVGLHSNQRNTFWQVEIVVSQNHSGRARCLETLNRRGNSSAARRVVSASNAPPETPPCAAKHLPHLRHGIHSCCSGSQKRALRQDRSSPRRSFPTPSTALRI